jgi:hypothetical protein
MVKRVDISSQQEMLSHLDELVTRALERRWNMTL